MRRTTRGLLVSVTVAAVTTAGAAIGVADASGGYTRPGKTERVSVASNGTQGNAGIAVSGCGDGHEADMSPDGRYVVFHSDATNLVPGDTNRMCDVFRHDRRTRKTVRVSVASDGSQALPGPGGSNGVPSVSADGRYVVFDSAAMNLVPGDTNLTLDVFIRDIKAGTTKRISVAPDGTQGDSSSGNQAISADGRYVVFQSSASNILPGDTNKTSDIFVRDLKSGKTRRANIARGGGWGDGMSFWPSISANGRYVSFSSYATNLVRDAGPAENPVGVFWHDMKTGNTRRVSVASDGSVVGAPALAELPVVGTIGAARVNICRIDTERGVRAISGDGRYVTFFSNATNLVPNDSNFSMSVTGFGMDVFVHDVKTRRTERVSVDSYGHDKEDASESGAISGNGRYVAYLTATGLKGCVGIQGLSLEATCSQGDVYLYDRVGGAMERLSASASGGDPRPGSCKGITTPLDPTISWSASNALNHDGRYALFWSSGRDLVKGDTNNACDFFVRDRGPERGTGGFGGVSSGSGPSDDLCLNEDTCLPPLAQTSSQDTVGDVRDPGADLIGASAVYRPASRDLFVRLDVERMPQVVGTSAGGVLYGVRFTADGQRFELRAQRVPGADFDVQGGASFGLFRQDPTSGLWTKVAALKGGYGTTGLSVVLTVPLKHLGPGSPRLVDVQAFTGVGSYLAGVTKSLDTIRLSR